MAATNYTPIQLYFSTTASAVPLAANLAQGELAINITDGKLYYEDNAGVVQVIATKGAGTIGGSTTQIQYNNAGALAGNAAMTFNSGTSTTTLTTLNLTNALGAIYGGTAQSAYTQGDFLYASATNTLSKLSIGTVNYILTSTGSVPQWSAPSSIIVQTATNLAGGAGGSVPYQSAVDTTTFLAIGAANRVMTSSGTVPQWVTSLTGLTGVSSSSITNTSLTSGRVVVSTTGGAQADDADLTFDGTTLSAGGYSTVGLSTLVKTVKIGDSNFSGVAVFAAATPAKLYIGTGTVTDTTSAIGATNAIGAISSLAITPIAATNTTVTYTNAATLYIAGAPSAGTNVTLTNPYSLYVAAGAAYFGGAVTVAGAVSFGALTVSSLTDSGLTAGRITYAGTAGLLSDSANLTYTSGVLTVSNTGGRSVAATGTSALFASNSAAHSLIIGDNNYAYFQFYTPSSPTYLAFQYNGVEKMRIDGSNGNIGFGGQVPPPNTVYPGLFLNYQTNLIPIGGQGGLYYNIYGVGTQLKWQVSSLGGSSYVFGPSSFTWSINGAGGTADTNASLTQYMQLTSSGLAVVGSVTASSLTSGRVTYAGTGGLLQDSANLTFNGSTLAITGALTATGAIAAGGNITGVGRIANDQAAGNQTIQVSTNSLAVGLGMWAGGDSRFYSTGTLQIIAGVTLSGSAQPTGGTSVASFSTTGLAVTGAVSATSYSVPSTNVAIARQAATDALEIKGTGAYTARFNNDTSTSLGGTLQISSNGVAYASTSAFMVQGYTYSSDFSIANATAQIIGTRMTNDTWNPTLNIVTARQSLTTGSLSFGGIGFSTIDASNSAGMRDGARIAIVNESTSAVASPTAMAFYTNAGSATQTFPAAEAGRFNSSGSLLLGTTSNSTGARLNVVGLRAARFESTQANTAGIVSQCNSANNDEPAVSASNINTSGSGLVTLYSSLGGTGASNTNCFHLKAITQGSAIYYLYGNGTSSFTSDARLKKNITTTRDGYAEDLCKLRVVKYNWNGAPEGEAQELGLIAQEVEQVFPNLVIDAADKIQGITPKVLKSSVLPFMLLKALQEQQAVIEQLKARLDAANL